MSFCRHVRVGIRRKDKRINSRGYEGTTVCGSPITSDDWTLQEFNLATPSEKAVFSVCWDCITKLAESELDNEPNITRDNITGEAFAIADAMLKAREQ